MAIQGNTKTFGLNEIIQSISMNQHSGMMEITCNDPGLKGKQKLMFFEKGNLTLLGKKDGPALDFADLLPRIGILSEKKVKEFRASQPTREPFKWGERLSEQKVLPDKILRSIVSQFYENEIFEMHCWIDADFVFQVGVSHSDKFPQLDRFLLVNISGERMVMEVLRQIDEVDLLSQKIPSLEDFYHILPDKKGEVAKLKLNPVQKRVIQKLEGSCNLQSILDDVFIGKLGLYQLLEILLDRDMLHPLSKQELRERGGYWQEMGQKEKAVTFLEVALKKDEADITTRIELAEVLRGLERYKEAAHHFEIIGSAYFEQENYREVGVYLRDALRLDPGNTSIQHKLLLAYLGLGDITNAKKMAQNLYMSFKKEGNYSAIEKIYQSLLVLDPSDFASKMILAEALANKEDQDLSQATVLYEEIAHHYELQNKQDQALRIYKILLQLNPRHSGSLRKVRLKEAQKAGGIKGLWVEYQWYILGLIVVIIVAVLIGSFVLK